jgi:hypothetical protein
VATSDHPVVWHSRQLSPKWLVASPSTLRCIAEAWFVFAQGVNMSGAGPPPPAEWHEGQAMEGLPFITPTQLPT